MLYRGRFAPSPTGPLHFGSLVAAVSSYLEARVHNGEWLVRIEDLDPPREVPGAAQGILRSLERFGFAWNDEVVCQSTRTEAYMEALAKLDGLNQTYPCACSRKEILAANGGRPGLPKIGPVYPGTCRNGLPPGRTGGTTRVRVDDASIDFDDAVQGLYRQNLATEGGDFVVRRRDGLFAYQLAVVVDDAEQHITNIVRGCDLLVTTPRQVWLQRLLGLTTPLYMHVPVAVNADGEKLSKQTGATAVDDGDPPATLTRALEFLGQNPPVALARGSVADVWGWALDHWRAIYIPRRRQVRFDTI